MVAGDHYCHPCDHEASQILQALQEEEEEEEAFEEDPVLQEEEGELEPPAGWLELTPPFKKTKFQ